MDGNPTSDDRVLRGLDEVGRGTPVSTARHAPHARRWDEASEDPTLNPFEDDSDAMWDEVMHNLGVDPSTGGPLDPTDPVPVKDAEQIARELKAFEEWRRNLQSATEGDEQDRLLPDEAIADDLAGEDFRKVGVDRLKGGRSGS